MQGKPSSQLSEASLARLWGSLVTPKNAPPAARTASGTPDFA
jgi:hypothetical protein